MKNFFVFLLLLPFMCFSQGPFWYVDYQIDPINENQLVWDFSNPDNMVWQYGYHHKPFFGDSTQKILITDTTTMYSSDLDTRVDLVLTRPSWGGWVNEGAAYVLKFDHKIDTDTNQAGGFFEFNIDNDSIEYIKNGDTLKTFWFKFFLNPDETANYADITPGYTYPVITDFGDTIMLTGNYSQHFHHYIHGFHDTITNGPISFTGTFSQWESFYAELFFDYGGIKTADQNDSLIFRFHFKSDANSSGKNGWAIKNIESGYAVHPVGGTSENTFSFVSVCPNPTYDFIKFTSISRSPSENNSIWIYSVNGQLIDIISFTNECELNISEYESDVYFYKIYADDGCLIQNGKIIKI